MTVLVLGGRGQLGSRVARRLLAEGRAVRAASRDPARLQDLVDLGAEAVRCDLRDRDSVRAAVSSADVVVHATHALAPPSRRNTPAAVDGAGVAALIDEAATRGVDLFVLSSLAHAREDHPVDFWRLKWQAEQRLQDADVPHLVVRMAAFTEVHALELLGEPIRSKGSVTLFGPGTAPRSMVSVDDAADVICDAVLGRHTPEPDVVTVTGPRITTDLELVELMEQSLGITARRRHVPLGVVNVLRRPVGWVHPGVGRLLQLASLTGAEGDAVDPTPRPGLIVGSRTVEDVIEEWASAVGPVPA